jgi:hypothetical protein
MGEIAFVGEIADPVGKLTLAHYLWSLHTILAE